MTREEAKKFGLQLLHGIMERNEPYPVYANNVKQAIDALSEESNSSEIPNDLEEAAEKYADGPECSWVGTSALEDAFKAGAEWQKKQDQETIELAEDHAMLAGMNKMEQQMMENAVEAEVYGCGDEMTPEISVELSEDYKPGDKVRVIVIKEDEK